MMNRQHERVTFDAECTLYLPEKNQTACRATDVSLGGMKVTTEENKKLFSYIGDECKIEFPVAIPGTIQMQPVFLSVKARIANGDPRGIGLAFQGVDQETKVLLEKLVMSNLKEDDLVVLRQKEGVSVKSNIARILQTQFQEYITTSVNDIFIAFLGMQVTPGPYVERPDFDDYTPPETDVTGVILFNGTLEGGVHLAAPLHVAVSAAGAMMGQAGLEFTREQDEMVWDAFGEITNQVAGSIQTIISGDFEGINMTSPNVIVGSNFKIKYKKSLSSVRQFFRSPFGPFYVECFFS
ncbi:MAG: chemotaxis protein CheX [Magnetococcales bacterium]|nr:chemotaxis protein CheX [Magnetococcales bacterium]